tara:strand:+ start:11 stop:1168 length:1158 start_codon:yes stop_codon:yes gene_type:complete
LSYTFDKFSDEKDFDFELNKQKFIDNMDMLKTMSVQEQTLYKKWQEFNKSDKLRSKADKLDRVQQQMWTPTDLSDKEKTIQEIQDLEPIVEHTTDNETWTLLRQGISSMEFVANPGRNQKFFVKDKKTNKYLGVICMGSDVVSIKVRDAFLGWTKENKLDDAKLQHTAIGTSIIATQPLGYNFLGGKLVSALVTCSTIRNKWKEAYDQTLAGITTTALYGVHSQYNGIPHWKTLGETAGQINLKPDDSIYLVWNQWLKENHPEEHHKAVNATGPKNNVINRIFKHLGMKAKDYQHGFKRGVYFADIYENGKEFFKSNIDEKDLIMKEKYQLDYDRIINWWKPKAIRRYEKLHSENRLKPEQLFYSDIMDMSWEETKQKYLGEVGR